MDVRIQKMAQVLINYSLAVKPGERVLLRASSPAAEPLVQALYQEVLKVGAHPIPYIHLRHEESLALEAAEDLNLLATVNPMLKLMFDECEVIIVIRADENQRELSGYPQAAQRARAFARAPLMNTLIEREGNGSLRRCVTLFPTEAYAQQAGISLPQYETFVYEACKLHLADPVAAWQAVADSQQKLVDWLAGKRHLHVKGTNIDLGMSIAGRTFLNACGKVNFPDGEIYTGPVEESVNGWVHFTYPAFYGGNEIKGIRLGFKDGLVTEASAERNEAYLFSLLDTDAGARRLGEFAIGTNTDIQRFTGATLFDEKIGGTVHMAIGNGFPQTGSVNRSAVHWDMVCDIRDGGEIRVDGERFYQDGQFTVRPA
ncbi:MAG: aminopeptidase [Caldilineaceae bacterium]|nr:aminopeptidase [Caldilineaceae bacterium]